MDEKAKLKYQQRELQMRKNESDLERKRLIESIANLEDKRRSYLAISNVYADRLRTIEKELGKKKEKLEEFGFTDLN